MLLSIFIFLIVFLGYWKLFDLIDDFVEWLAYYIVYDPTDTPHILWVHSSMIQLTFKEAIRKLWQEFKTFVVYFFTFNSEVFIQGSFMLFALGRLIGTLCDSRYRRVYGDGLAVTIIAANLSNEV